jgi:hypothetical protein
MENTNDTRIYNRSVDIDSGSIRAFWDAKAKGATSFQAVLLGAGTGENSSDLRNERERVILNKFITPPVIMIFLFWILDAVWDDGHII